MTAVRFLPLLVPLLGLGELAAHYHFAARAPGSDEWSALAPAVAAFRRNAELVIAAPSWADPLARASLGESLMPLRDVARPDDTRYARAIEISLLGQHAPELAGWTELERRSVGRFTLRKLDNPRSAAVLFDFVDAIGPGRVDAREGEESAERECRWSDRARVVTGGLPGPLTFPSRRFVCSGSEEQFVGVTVLDDQNYRPRRCIWAHPPASGALRVVFHGVPLGKSLYGYAGLTYLLTRDGAGTPVELSALIEGERVGRMVHRDESGWEHFEFPVGTHRGTVDVTFEVKSASASNRGFCFAADSR